MVTTINGNALSSLGQLAEGWKRPTGAPNQVRMELSAQSWKCQAGIPCQPTLSTKNAEHRLKKWYLGCRETPAEVANAESLDRKSDI
jgi:hypothetical protein